MSFSSFLSQFLIVLSVIGFMFGVVAANTEEDVGYLRVRELAGKTYKVRHFAGDGQLSKQGDGGLATKASFWYASGIAADAFGNVFVSELQRIRKIDANGIITTFAGTGIAAFKGDNGPAINAALNYPAELWLDAQSSTMLIADSQNNRIRQIDAGGIITTVAGNGLTTYSAKEEGGPATSATLFYPMMAMKDANGIMYIADTYHGRIRKVQNGLITTIAGSGTAVANGTPALSLKLSNPFSVHVTSNGVMYIADKTAKTLYKIVNGVSTAVVKSLAVNSLWKQDDNLFFTHMGNSIRAVDNQDLTTIVGGTGSIAVGASDIPATSALFKTLSVVAGGKDSSLYVWDNTQFKIYKLTPTA